MIQENTMHDRDISNIDFYSKSLEWFALAFSHELKLLHSSGTAGNISMKGFWLGQFFDNRGLRFYKKF